MLYLLNFHTSDLFSYQQLSSYTVDILVLVKTPDIGSLFFTFNNFLCVVLQVLLFEAHTVD